MQKKKTIEEFSSKKKERKGIKENITSRVSINIGQCKKGTGSLREDKFVNNKTKAKKFLSTAMFSKREVMAYHVKTLKNMLQ